MHDLVECAEGKEHDRKGEGAVEQVQAPCPEEVLHIAGGRVEQRLSFLEAIRELQLQGDLLVSRGLLAFVQEVEACRPLGLEGLGGGRGQ